MSGFRDTVGDRRQRRGARTWWSAEQHSGAGSRRRRGLGALAAGALALVLAVSGCSSIGLGGQPAPPRDPAAEATARQPPQGQDGAGAVLPPAADVVGVQELPLRAAHGAAGLRQARRRDRLHRGAQGRGHRHTARLPRGQPRRTRRVGRPVRRRRRLHRRQAGARQLRHRRVRPPRGRRPPSPSTAWTTASSTPSSVQDPTPDTRPRSRPSPPVPRPSPPRARPSARPAAGPRLDDRGGQGHGHPAGGPRLTPSWTTSASPTAPSSARPTPTCSPQGGPVRPRRGRRPRPQLDAGRPGAGRGVRDGDPCLRRGLRQGRRLPPRRLGRCGHAAAARLPQAAGHLADPCRRPARQPR